jgi:probable blue pigment (indigoidine) exporter
LALEQPFVVPTSANLIGYAWLALPGAALTYCLWFRGIARLGPATVAPLGLLSPLVAVVIGWLALGQTLSLLQLAGMAVVLLSVWAGLRDQGQIRRHDRNYTARRGQLQAPADNVFGNANATEQTG